jgi:hypothetical protein
MQSNPVHCLHCKAELGNIVTLNNTEFIVVGNIICEKIKGVCPNCGKGFYWSISDKVFEKIADYIKKNQMNML